MIFVAIVLAIALVSTVIFYKRKLRDYEASYLELSEVVNKLFTQLND